MNKIQRNILNNLLTTDEKEREKMGYGNFGTKYYFSVFRTNEGYVDDFNSNNLDELKSWLNESVKDGEITEILYISEEPEKDMETAWEKVIEKTGLSLDELRLKEVYWINKNGHLVDYQDCEWALERRDMDTLVKLLMR